MNEESVAVSSDHNNGYYRDATCQHTMQHKARDMTEKFVYLYNLLYILNDFR